MRASDDDSLLRLGLWAVTAVSVGESVEILLCAAPLARLVRDGLTPAKRPEGLPPPLELLQNARELGPLRVVTCHTELQLAGLAEDDVRARVDEIVSLPSFWRASAGARTIVL